MNSKNDFPFPFYSSLPYSLSKLLFSSSSQRQDVAARSQGNSYHHKLTRIFKCSVSNRKTCASGLGQNKDRPSHTKEKSLVSFFQRGRSWICPLEYQLIFTVPDWDCKVLLKSQALLLLEVNPPFKVTQRYVYLIQERSCITSSLKGIFIFNLY